MVNDNIAPSLKNVKLNQSGKQVVRGAVREREATELLGEWQKALTDRQKQILGLLQAGKTQSEIARELGVTKQEISRQVLRLREQAKSLLMQRDMFYQAEGRGESEAISQKQADRFQGDFLLDEKGNKIPMASGVELSADQDVRDALAAYIAEHIGEFYTIAADGNLIEIGSKLPHEYTRSSYSEKLRRRNPELWNVKVESASALGGMIEVADHRGQAQAPKHGKHLPGGVFVEYDTRVAVPVSQSSVNLFGAKLVVYEARSGRHFLYDIKEIKKLGADVIYDTRLNSESNDNIHHQGEKSSGKQVVRGATRFAEDFDTSFRAAIALFKDADASTLPHEAAHWMKKMMEALVELL